MMPENPHSHLKSILSLRPRGEKWEYPDQPAPYTTKFDVPSEEGMAREEYANLLLILLKGTSKNMQLFDRHRWSIEKQEDQLNIVFTTDRVPLNCAEVGHCVQTVIRMALFAASAAMFVKNQNSEISLEERNRP